jgi:uncharacterized protein (TIGR03435 family)
MRLRSVSLAIVAAAAMGMAQTQFEVASIKVSGPQSVRGSSGGPGSRDPGQYRFDVASLLDLICVAYDVDRFQVASKTPLDRQRVDLVAKIPAGTTKEQFRVMLQNLLAERFHLKLHAESRDFSAYELGVAKTGVKLTESTNQLTKSTNSAGADRPSMSANFTASGGYQLVKVKAHQSQISALASMVRGPDDPPIVDKTGLTAKYDFTLEYSREIPSASASGPADPPVAPSLSIALQQQLGLQLVARKLPFDVIVVDSVDKLPTEN